MGDLQLTGSSKVVLAHSGSVVYCSPKAYRQGVRPGMSLELAQALVPELLVGAYDPWEYLKALRKLALWALRFTPLVSLDLELTKIFTDRLRLKGDELIPALSYGLVLDITGTERLHQGRLHKKDNTSGEEQLATRLLTSFRAAKVPMRLAVAPTIGSAWALSRYSTNVATHVPSLLSSQADLRKILAPLPLEALRIAPKIVTGLNELGISRIGELNALPQKTLLTRFGVELVKRLDQAYGLSEELLEPVQLLSSYNAKRRFETPLSTQSAIITVTLKLFQTVLEQLSRVHKRGALFQLSFEGRDQDFKKCVFTKTISLPAAVTNIRSIKTVLTTLIEQLAELKQFQHGVHALSVSAHMPETLRYLQSDFCDGTQVDELEQPRAEFLNTMVGRLGRERVCTVRFVEAYLPEHSFAYTPLTSQPLKTDLARENVAQLVRPPYLFPTPQAITVVALLPDHPPALINWNGKRYFINEGFGPERIAQRWWRSDSSGGEHSERDYFKLQDQQGRWLWVFRMEANWFVHGLWC